ncbi:hypothetical protein K439DRAFT_50519 [Ramaria rubella]|nr:hypothetical protein K439DRAFT_50519 [Ramaria rubella]
MTLYNVVSPSTRNYESFVLIQNTLATPWLPLLHAILNGSKAAVVCVCLLHPPATLLPANLNAKILDWTEHVPGYEDGENHRELLSEVYRTVDDAPHGPVLLVIDSADTLCEDIGSPSKAYIFLKTLLSAIEKRSDRSRLILPLSSRSSLLPLIITPDFSPSLTHLTLHPPSLLHHIATAYFTFPPPYSPPPKFWSIFSGLSSRLEAEQFVWGTKGNGWGDETVVELVVRSTSGKRTIDRTLEGWKQTGICELEDLEELKAIWGKRAGNSPESQAVDPTQNLPFNLSLTETQQHSRAQVPLPYAHEGQRVTSIGAGPGPGAILYDPDSADDIDEDDPDEDLDI